MELYKDKSIPTNPRIVFKVKAFAGEVSTDFPEEVILLKINKTLTRHTFTVGDNIEYQLSDTEQIFTDGERFKVCDRTRRHKTDRKLVRYRFRHR